MTINVTYQAAAERACEKSRNAHDCPYTALPRSERADLRHAMMRDLGMGMCEVMTEALDAEPEESLHQMVHTAWSLADKSDQVRYRAALGYRVELITAHYLDRWLAPAWDGMLEGVA